MLCSVDNTQWPLAGCRTRTPQHGGDAILSACIRLHSRAPRCQHSSRLNCSSCTAAPHTVPSGCPAPRITYPNHLSTHNCSLHPHTTAHAAMRTQLRHQFCHMSTASVAHQFLHVSSACMLDSSLPAVLVLTSPQMQRPERVVVVGMLAPRGGPRPLPACMLPMHAPAPTRCAVQRPHGGQAADHARLGHRITGHRRTASRDCNPALPLLVSRVRWC